MTIDKILFLHNLTAHLLLILEDEGKVNGCGGQGGFNFDLILKEFLLNIKEFDYMKKAKLYQDLRMICLIHDYNFLNKKGFYKSNFLFVRDLYLLLNWIKFFKRIILLIFIFTILNIFGKKYYG